MNKAIIFRKTIIWSLFMLVIFLLPAKNLSKAPSGAFLSEAVHFGMFLVFSYLFLLEQIKARKLKYPALGVYLSTIFGSAIFGGAIELLQKYSDFGRTAEWQDILWDTAGCLFLIIVVVVFAALGKFERLKIDF